MSIYETVKAAISVKDAAEQYGLKVNRNGMTCCPFHDDRHPSLKLNEDYFLLLRLRGYRRCNRLHSETVRIEQLRSCTEAGCGLWA